MAFVEQPVPASTFTTDVDSRGGRAIAISLTQSIEVDENGILSTIANAGSFEPFRMKATDGQFYVLSHDGNAILSTDITTTNFKLNIPLLASPLGVLYNVTIDANGLLITNAQ